VLNKKHKPLHANFSGIFNHLQGTQYALSNVDTRNLRTTTDSDSPSDKNLKYDSYHDCVCYSRQHLSLVVNLDDIVEVEVKLNSHWLRTVSNWSKQVTAKRVLTIHQKLNESTLIWCFDIFRIRPA